MCLPLTGLPLVATNLAQLSAHSIVCACVFRLCLATRWTIYDPSAGAARKHLLTTLLVVCTSSMYVSLTERLDCQVNASWPGCRRNDLLWRSFLCTKAENWIRKEPVVAQKSQKQRLCSLHPAAAASGATGHHLLNPTPKFQGWLFSPTKLISIALRHLSIS
jgi:hypothetical protein